MVFLLSGYVVCGIIRLGVGAALMSVSFEVCSTCTYWQSKKGSFGFCKTFPQKIYDGTKKGSACINWRPNRLLYKIITREGEIISLQHDHYISKTEKTEYKSLRGLYNKSKRPKFKATHATNVDGEFVTFTSDIHTKNGYYKHRYNYTIIDTCLTLFLNGKTFEQICSHLEANHCKTPSRRTFREWVIKFLNKNAWDERFGSEVFAMCIKDKIPLRKDGKNKKGKQQWECKKCLKKIII